MLPKKAISTFISELNGRIPPPVHTSGIEDSRPVPAVLLDRVTITDVTHHNDTFAGYEWNESGEVVTAEIDRHYYTLRIELLVRDDDETDAYEHLGSLKKALSKIEKNPRTHIHKDVTDFSTDGSGSVSYAFKEPTETEINQTVEIDTFYDTKDSDVDVLDTLQTNLNIS